MNNPIKNLTNKLTYTMFVLLMLGFNSNAQQQARLSIEFRGGLPSILTESNPSNAPFGGLGVRYSFNKYLSLSGDANGGGIAGRSAKNGYFRNSFTQFGGKINVNVTSFLPERTETWSKFNAYVSLGANYFMYYYDKDAALNGKTSKPYFIYDAGLSVKYYVNEMIDLMAGVTFNFSQTSAIDNVRGDGKFDKFALSYVGIAFKILPEERKQHLDWTHLPLRNNESTLAVTKQLVANLDRDMREMDKRGNDSVTKALRAEIKVVDDKVVTVNAKVDTLDTKLNMVLELLNKMSTQGLPEATKGKTATTKNKAATTKIVANNPTKPTETKPEKSSPQILSYTSPEGSKIKAATIDQSQVKENYAIVVGSFLVDDNAIAARDKFIDKGWDAHILGSAKNNYKRIVIFSNNYFEAAKIVTELRTTVSKDVWMLDINTGKGVYIK